MRGLTLENLRDGWDYRYEDGHEYWWPGNVVVCTFFDLPARLGDIFESADRSEIEDMLKVLDKHRVNGVPF